jgi:hypothetical protein
MSYGDVFFMLGLGLVLSLIASMLLKKGAGSAAGAH